MNSFWIFSTAIPTQQILLSRMITDAKQCSFVAHTTRLLAMPPHKLQPLIPWNTNSRTGLKQALLGVTLTCARTSLRVQPHRSHVTPGTLRFKPDLGLMFHQIKGWGLGSCFIVLCWSMRNVCALLEGCDFKETECSIDLRCVYTNTDLAKK